MAKARMATAALSGLVKLNNFQFGGIGKGELRNGKKIHGVRLLFL